MALLVATLFFAFLVVLVVFDEVSTLVLVLYGVLSVVALAMYRVDKSAAGREARRIPESSLHVVALLGGWPGALMARQLFRHKTRKQPFRTVFWLTVIANCLVLVWLVFGLPPWW